MPPASLLWRQPWQTPHTHHLQGDGCSFASSHVVSSHPPPGKRNMIFPQSRWDASWHRPCLAESPPPPSSALTEPGSANKAGSPVPGTQQPLSPPCPCPAMYQPTKPRVPRSEQFLESCLLHIFGEREKRREDREKERGRKLRMEGAKEGGEDKKRRAV